MQAMHSERCRCSSMALTGDSTFQTLDSVKLVPKLAGSSSSALLLLALSYNGHMMFGCLVADEDLSIHSLRSRQLFSAIRSNETIIHNYLRSRSNILDAWLSSGRIEIKRPGYARTKTPKVGDISPGIFYPTAYQTRLTIRDSPRPLNRIPETSSMIG